MAGMGGGRRLPATHYRKSADKAVGADKTLRCVYFLKFLYLLLFCLFFKVFCICRHSFSYISRQGSQDQAPAGSRDSQKSNPGIFWDFQKPLNDCIPRLSTT